MTKEIITINGIVFEGELGHEVADVAGPPKYDLWIDSAVRLRNEDKHQEIPNIQSGHRIDISWNDKKYACTIENHPNDQSVLIANANHFTFYFENNKLTAIRGGQNPYRRHWFLECFCCCCSLHTDKN